jgi:hypothetical protein
MTHKLISLAMTRCRHNMHMSDCPRAVSLVSARSYSKMLLLDRQDNEELSSPQKQSLSEVYMEVMREVVDSRSNVGYGQLGL